MPNRNRFSRLTLGVAALVVAGCSSGHDAVAPDTRPASLHLVAGAGVTDTIETISAPITVEVRNASGSPVAAASVLFQLTAEKGVAIEPPPFIDRGGSGHATCCATYFTALTDASGRATVRVGFGTMVQALTLTYSVPETSLRDSLRFVVEPGVSSQIVGVADTAMILGSSARFSASARDRRGNATSDAVAFVGSGPTLSVGADATVTASAYGVGSLDISAGPATKRVMVSVVPDARLLASLTDGQSSNSVLALFSTDGTGRRAIPGTAATSGDRGPSWAPDGEHFVFHLGGRLMFGDTLGAITRAIPDAAGLNEELWGEYTHDGQLVYFGGRTGTQNAEIWRVHSDGTNAERAGPAAGFYDVDYQPSPSPDGARVVFETNRAGAALGMLDTSTGAVTYLQVPAIRARWSPVGDTIAVLDAGIVKLIHADGSIIRIVGNPAGGYAGTMSWSPDGRWLVINRAGLVELIDTRGGAGIPLPQSAGYSEAAWRPDR